MPEDQLYSGITETLKKHGIGLPTTPTARPASEITAPPPKDNLLSGIQDTLKKHGIGVPTGAGVPEPVPAAIQQVPPTPDFTKHLQDNRHLDFVDRALKPEKYPTIKNEDGSESSHLMSSAEVEGKHIAYPTIVRRQGEDALTKLSPDEAVEHARETGEHITFPTAQEADQFASGGYKGAAAKLRKTTSAAPEGAYPLGPPALPEAFAPTRQPSQPPMPEAPGERGFFGEIGASLARGAGGVAAMPRGFLGAFDIKTGPTEALAKSGKELAKEYPESPSVSGGLTEHPSLLVNPKWWASAAPSMALQLIPIAIAAVGGTLVGGPVGGAVGGLAAGGVIGVSDAGERMMAYEEEHGTEIPTLAKITIGLGAGTAGALLPGRTVERLVGGKVVSVAAEKAMAQIFGGAAGKAIAERAVNATVSGGSMAGFSVIENAFEKYGYNPDRELTQGVMESLVLGTALGGVMGEIHQFKKRAAERGDRAYAEKSDLEALQQQLQEAYDHASGGRGTVIGEAPPEVKPVLDQFGRPASPDAVQAALAKQPFERNAHEKLLADQAQKEARGEIQPTAAPGTADIIPGTAARERANVGEASVDRLQRAVDVVGDSDAGKKLGDLLAGNQNTLANAFRAPGEAPGIPEITDKIMDLAQKVEDTGDPGAAKELHDFINSNLGALKGLPRWPTESTQPITAAQPLATAGHVSEDLGTPPAPKPAAPATPAAPMGVAGGTAENLAAKPVEPVVEAPTPTPTETVPPVAPDVGIEKPPVPEWTPPAKRSRTYDFDRAVELGDIDTMILANGGFDSKSEIFKDLESEERNALFRYMRNKVKFPTVKGPDVMFQDFKEAYPHLFPWETESDWLHALARGEHKKTLMGDEIYAKMEAQNDYIAKKADSEGLSPEALARIEADVEREVATEEIAGRSAKPGEFDTSWDAATAFGLSPRKKPASRLETRLDALQADYPGIDRERAAEVIRALPNAEDGQIINMAADPEMFAAVARGNLSASEKAQLLKKATDAGAQGDLFGGGAGGGLFDAPPPADGKKYSVQEARQYAPIFFSQMQNHLADKLPGKGTGADLAKLIEGWGAKGQFKAGEEAAFTRGLTTEQIQGRLGKGGTVSELAPETFPADSPYARGWTMLFKNGQMAMVFEAKDGSLKIGPGETLGVDYSALGITSLEGKHIAGSFKPVSFGSVIELARGGGPRTFDHESWHHIEHWLLNDKERAAVIKQFGDNEEVRAEAYANWNPKEAPNTVFQKILDFFQRITKALTGKVTGEDVFAAARKGELFGRETVERGLPEALAPGKYRVEEGGEWGMAGGLAGKVTGNARAAREEGKAAKNWLMNLFASNRTSKEALQTHQIIAGSQAESATEKLRMQNIFMKYVDDMGSIKGPETQEFLKLYESGQEAQITHPVFKAFAEEFRAEERRHMEIMTMLGDAPKEISNYIDHLWKQNEAAEQIKAQLMSQISGGRSMRGPDYFKLLRTVVDIPSGIAAGLEPKFDTLPEMVLAGRSARENRIAATKRLNFIKENGYEKVVRALDGGTFTVEGADGKEQTFKSVNEARKWAKDNPGSSEPRFEPDVPQGWAVYPGGYGEVWAKVKRRAGAMIPEGADEETMPLGGGPDRAGYEEVPKVDAWSRVGHRVGPEDVVRQFEDFLSRGMSGNTAFEIYQSGLHAVRHSQMAFSFFHAFFESINSVATHAGGGIFDSLGGLFTGDWQRMGGGLKTWATSPFAPWTDIKLGLNINKTLMENGIGVPGEATNNQLLKDARTLVGGGMRPEVESKLIKILSNHFKEAWKLKGVSTGRAINELLQGLSSPTMEVVVPFSKQGSTMFNYLAEVKRWERDNPGVAPTEKDLRNIAYECRQTSDFIYGRMAKDNVAMNGMVKSLLTGVLQFPTWQFGTVGAGARSMIGAKDLVGKVFDMMQGKEIRQLAMKDRQALQYVTGLLFTVGMTGALMTYALTGKKPETMADYFFPKTGEINPNGSEERLQLPSYFKDAMGFTHHPFKTIGAKLASPIHILTDLIQNKDYWGNQVYDPHDWAGQRGIDVLKYMAKTSAPFVLQSFEQGAKQTPGRAAMSLFGVRPVPRETANTPAQNVIDEYNQMMRASVTTKESAETKKLKGDLMKMARDQDESGFQEAAGQAVSEGKITRQQVKEIVGESQAPPNMSRFTRLPLEWATRAYDAGSDYEKEQWTPYYLKKVMNEKPENLIKHREPVVATLKEMGLDEAADAVDNLVMPEEPIAGIDLTGLGVQRAAPEMGGMEDVDTAIAQALEQNLKGKEKRVSANVRLPSTRKKKRPYEVLGL